MLQKNENMLEYKVLFRGGFMSYTKEEKKKIKETIKVIAKDLRALWNLYPYEEVKINLPFQISGYAGDWCLVMDEKNIKIKSKVTSHYTNLEKGFTVGDYDDDAITARLYFIEAYEKVRAEVDEIQQFRAQKHHESLNKMDEIQNKYSEKSKKEAKKLESTVQIDFNSQNAHEIEITEENGSKIGIIKFGKQTIKLITEGDIIVIDKTKTSSKTKQK